MAATDPRADTPGKQTGTRTIILIGVGIVAGMFVFDDLLALFQGGGLFSVISAFRAAAARARSVDVDPAGLRTIFVADCGIAATLIATQLRVDIGRRLVSNILIWSILGGGFVLDGLYGEETTRHLMFDRGYSRCAIRDHVVGSGKSRVWFENYVLIKSDCALRDRPASPSAATLPNDPRTALPRPAKSIGSPAAWFSSDDYPSSALRRNIAGRVKVAYTVDPDGRVGVCKTIVTSGSQLLDATSCGLFVTNARYWPARDRAGKAASQQETQSVTWQIPPG